ncbi:hypothetical protein ACPCSQ_29340 [Streptomyces griseoincarnatus]|uniref:hypothetical protein n=1 Tax=Streptomyces sp. SMS_SU21 TaxID=2069440 RepID=UPI000C885CA6|nr:hypothetical protein [Streptomyces sp. SMS_SU21]MCA2199685.1 hypothetical protein [Streptomyces sp. SMS_SU21]NEA92574.1 hypothetical protein [Actinospica acidiphila]
MSLPCPTAHRRPESRKPRTGVTETASPAVLDALAAVVGVSRMHFEPNAAAAAQVYEGLQLLAAAKKGAG